MRELTKTWKLRRNLGVHPVGSVADRRWPEAGITAQVIPARASFRSLSEGTGPTRPPTGVVVNDLRDLGPRNQLCLQLKYFIDFQAEVQPHPAQETPSHCKTR